MDFVILYIFSILLVLLPRLAVCWAIVELILFIRRVIKDSFDEHKMFKKSVVFLIVSFCR